MSAIHSHLDHDSAKAETTAYESYLNDEILSQAAAILELLDEQKSTLQFKAKEKAALSQK